MKVWKSVLVVLFLVSAPVGRNAAAGQEQTTDEKRDEVRERQAEVTLEVDALEGEHTELEAALVSLSENVTAWEAELEEGERAAKAADDDFAFAERAVAAAERRLEALEVATDEFVVDAYVNPPAATTFATLSAKSMSDATIKEVLIDLRSHRGADLFDQLAQAHEDLEDERETAKAVAAEAEEKRSDAETTLANLTTAHDQQERFVQEVEEALESKVAEAAVLAGRDQELSEQIADEQAELARQLEAARQAAEAQRKREAEAAAAAATAGASTSPPSNGGGAVAAPASGGATSDNPASGGGAGPAAAAPGTIKPVPGGLATVSCPRGGSITVAGSMAPGLRQLLDAAAADGVRLCGWGWRDPQRQIELRRAHCGSSDYAIWHMPASQCSPPTARPGTSMHERGLAVDFTCDGGSVSTRSNPCYRWLSSNAARFGLYNLPSEPWHWSTNGR